VFTRMMEGLAAVRTEPKTVMIDATYLKAHRTDLSLRVKKGSMGAGGAGRGILTFPHCRAGGCSCLFRLMPPSARS